MPPTLGTLHVKIAPPAMAPCLVRAWVADDETVTGGGTTREGLYQWRVLSGDGSPLSGDDLQLWTNPRTSEEVNFATDQRGRVFGYVFPGPGTFVIQVRFRNKLGEWTDWLQSDPIVVAANTRTPLYAASTGSDSNDGLTVGSPKGTYNGAVAGTTSTGYWQIIIPDDDVLPITATVDRINRTGLLVTPTTPTGRATISGAFNVNVGGLGGSVADGFVIQRITGQGGFSPLRLHQSNSELVCALDCILDTENGGGYLFFTEQPEVPLYATLFRCSNLRPTSTQVVFNDAHGHLLLLGCDFRAGARGEQCVRMTRSNGASDYCAVNFCELGNPNDFETGVAEAGGTTTTTTTLSPRIADAIDDKWNNLWLRILTGARAGEAVQIWDWNTSTNTLLHGALTDALSAGDTFAIDGQKGGLRIYTKGPFDAYMTHTADGAVAFGDDSRDQGDANGLQLDYLIDRCTFDLRSIRRGTLECQHIHDGIAGITTRDTLIIQDPASGRPSIRLNNSGHSNFSDLEWINCTFVGGSDRLIDHDVNSGSQTRRDVAGVRFVNCIIDKPNASGALIRFSGSLYSGSPIAEISHCIFSDLGGSFTYLTVTAANHNWAAFAALSITTSIAQQNNTINLSTGEPSGALAPTAGALLVGSHFSLNGIDRTLAVASQYAGVWQAPAVVPPAIAISLNFRQTNAGSYTDLEATGQTEVLQADTYAVTRDGRTFGWTAGFREGRNRDFTQDPRLAGMHMHPNSSSGTFRLDGLAAGTYIIDLALGDATQPQSHQHLVIRDSDNTAVLLTIAKPSGHASGQFFDATGTLRASAAAWLANRVTAEITITGASLYVHLGNPSAGSANSTIAHLSVTSGIAPPHDVTAPVLAWVAPAGNDVIAVVGDSINLEATAVDDVTTLDTGDYPEFYRGVALIGTGTAPVAWNTTGLSPGTHTVTASATDEALNTAVILRTVYLIDPVITAPLDDAEVTMGLPVTLTLVGLGPTPPAGMIVTWTVLRQPEGEISFAPVVLVGASQSVTLSSLALYDITVRISYADDDEIALLSPITIQAVEAEAATGSRRLGQLGLGLGL